MTRSILITTLLLAVAALASPLFAGTAAAQEHPVGGLRISDESGEAIGELPSPPGEKHFHLDPGVQGFHIAFEYTGSEPTDVQVRVLGPMGTILFQDAQSYDSPGTYVVEFDNGSELSDNEYVVNAYVGGESYLADSLQLAIGSASIPISKVDEVEPVDEAAASSGAEAMEPVEAPATAGPLEAREGQVPGGPSQWMLLLAAAGILILLAVVLWAARSATRS